ncbi:hypothetical protein GUITHDRAFT_164791 [Guillardia theta CCMP2712]|uniref:PDZ domain-containing protein n=1 Tax=Guillardia theta (strain CCMP2712) TaxID=905079 RepID=L1IUZ3_GUITC|nr:hypothetical protein GUITHDRAFT_164791 [Guillardia theta CCMP2712]EKX39907.1 hypothetical protein GUITHDRAFT_164791 [Guillardia theta CCMP2712]|mmetsp:Transcript_46748/g.146567  ORF Transcript_46748/g.146567 Transcript_46748/m.146567 type:complete len:474 (-) Transcript_46748:27-1448(-)|eukprot:XP_005826887.1 hypothetical protein GUITHDRAFT_164791 [Guillardia theta CCMP2712]
MIRSARTIVSSVLVVQALVYPADFAEAFQTGSFLAAKRPLPLPARSLFERNLHSVKHATSLRRPCAVQLTSQVDLLPAVAPALQAVLGGVSSLSGAAVLCGVVAFHEAGHFLAAKVQGIKINDFCIGFGPKVFGFKDRDGVEYSLRLLPLGGYVSFPEAQPVSSEMEGPGSRSDDEKAEEEDGRPAVKYDIDDPDLIQNRPALQRAFVISAGVLFNMLLAWGAIFGSVTSNGVAIPVLDRGVVVSSLVDGKGAGARYGMKPGDIIVEIDGKDIGKSEKAVAELVQAVKKSSGRSMKFVVKRAEGLVPLDVTPDRVRSGDGVIGVKLGPNVIVSSNAKPKGVAEAVVMTNQQFVTLTSETFFGFGKLFTHFKDSVGNLAGPVGVMQMGAEAGKQGTILAFIALISINLGIMNALPIPALDGGQLVMVLVEAIRRRPLNSEVTRTVNGAFLAILLGASLTLLVGDLERLIPASLK